jgi:hypothetical protein
MTRFELKCRRRCRIDVFLPGYKKVIFSLWFFGTAHHFGIDYSAEFLELHSPTLRAASLKDKRLYIVYGAHAQRQGPPARRKAIFKTAWQKMSVVRTTDCDAAVAP